MSMFSSLDISASALFAQRVRMDVIAQNIANANTTRTETGEPYRRKVVLFEERKSDFSDILNNKINNQSSSSGGVRVKAIIEDNSPFKKVYDPSHPDADQNGYVNMPNVDTVIEMVNMIEASRAYEANLNAMSITKSLISKSFDIGR